MTTQEPAPLGNRARIKRVLRNPQIRRVQLAFLGSTLGDWAYSTAVVVWAYQQGGATAVGAYQAVRFVSMSVSGPLGGVIADRVSRRTFMIVCDALRAALVALAALVVGLHGPALAVYGLAVLAAIVGAPFRAAQAGLLPQLVDAPEDLTAANALSGNIESTMIFAGPALAGLMITVWDVETVFWLNVATFIWSILLLLGVHARTAAAAPPEAGEAEDPVEAATGFWSELSSGLGLMVRNRDLRNVGVISSANGFAWGALTVFLVLIAIDVLDGGPQGVGYLNSVLGIATTVGGVLVLGRLSSSRLGNDMVVGALGWALPLLALAAFLSPVTAFVAVAVMGASEPLFALGADTIPQRIAPPEYVSRVYSAVDLALLAPMSLGALLAPHLVDLLGLRGAIAVPGALIAITALTRWPQMRDLDRRLEAPAELELLRAVPVFADLPAPALERLAHTSERARVAAGSVVVAQGAVSDRFYVIVSGEVQVTQDGVLRRTEGPGEFFGEIGLLRDVLRTATVTATAATELLVVDRTDFLDAVSLMGEARSGLEAVLVHRLYA